VWALHFRIRDVSSETGRSNLSLTDMREHGFSCQKVFQNAARRSPKLWRSCVPLQFRDASNSLPMNGSGKPLHADRHLLALFSCASTSSPKSAQQRRCRSENFRRNPPFAFGVIPYSQRLQIEHRRLDSSLHPTVPLRRSAETMPRANCRRQSRHHHVMGW
jgi:hypothetical protein